MVVWTTWPHKRYWGGGPHSVSTSSETHCVPQCVITTLRRSLAWPCINLLPLIAHATRLACIAIDRPQSPIAALGNAFALGWSAQKLLSASEKSVTLNAIVIRVLQALLQMRYFCHQKTLCDFWMINFSITEFHILVRCTCIAASVLKEGWPFLCLRSWVRLGVVCQSVPVHLRSL